MPSSPPDRSSDPWGERLARKLGLGSAIAIVVGSTIGSGIFRTPAEVAHRLDRPELFAAAWILGAAIAICGALSFAELAGMYPRSGGLYVYLRQAYGDRVAFLFGWAELLLMRPAAYGAIAITCTEYSFRAVGVDGGVAVLGELSRSRVAAAVLIAVVAGLNVVGVRVGAWIQNTSTILKLAALAALVLVGLLLPTAHPLPPHPVPVTDVPPSSVAAFGLALVALLWAYDGWADLGFIAGEVRDPNRTLPRAFVLGTSVVAASYLAVNFAYAKVVELRDMPGSPLIAADVAYAVLGGVGTTFVAGAVALSTFGTLNGTLMTGPRVFFAMAGDGLFFARFAATHRRWGTPAWSIALAATMGVVFVSIRSFSELADQFVIGIWPFYALGVLAVFVLRVRRPEVARPYRVLGHPWVPAVFLAATLFLLGNYLLAQPMLFAANLGVVALGLPVHAVWSRRRRGRPERAP